MPKLVLAMLAALALAGSRAGAMQPDPDFLNEWEHESAGLTTRDPGGAGPEREARDSATIRACRCTDAEGPMAPSQVSSREVPVHETKW